MCHDRGQIATWLSVLPIFWHFGDILRRPDTDVYDRAVVGWLILVGLCAGAGIALRLWARSDVLANRAPESLDDGPTLRLADEAHRWLSEQRPSNSD